MSARRSGAHPEVGMSNHDEDAPGVPEPDDGPDRDRAESGGGGCWAPAPRLDVGTRLPDGRVRTSTGHEVDAWAVPS
jgi:hypothetical protein